jgi:uncharacterized protein YjiS (DUF1127 family)
MLHCNIRGCGSWHDPHMLGATGPHRRAGRIGEGRATLPAAAGHASPSGSVFTEIGPVNLLSTLSRLWTLHRAFHAVYAELARRSDRELRDMGIARGDIARLAYAEAERRIAPSTPSHRAEAPAPAAWPAPALEPGR